MTTSFCTAAELNSQNQDNGDRWDTEIKWMTTKIKSVHLTWKNTKKKIHFLLTYKVVTCLHSKTIHYNY